MWLVMGRLLFPLLENSPKRDSFLKHSRVSGFLPGFESLEITIAFILLNSSILKIRKEGRKE